MEEVICSCLKCEAELGRFKNSWNGIGSTYYSPVYPPVTYINGFETTGDVNQAAPGSLVENSFLQDLACRKCQTVIGMRCDSAPEGHMLKKNQILLRLLLMSVISLRTGKKAVISVQEKFALTLPGAKKLSTSRRASTVQPSRRSETPSMMSSRKPINGSMPPPPPPDKPQRDLDKFKSWAEDAISKQKKDIDRIGGTVDRIERAMKSFEIFMQEIRAELITSREEVPNQEDLASIRGDLNGFRDELASYQQIQHPKQQDLSVIRDKLHGLRRDIDLRSEPDVSRHDFGVLVKDVQKVDRKASHIEEVKAQLEALKSRFDFLEDATRNASFSKEDEVDMESLIENPVELTIAEGAFVDPRTLELRRSDEESSQQMPETTIPRSSHVSLENAALPLEKNPTIIRDSEEGDEPMGDVIKEALILPKRKRNHVEDSAEAPDSERPTKRARRIIRKPSGVGIVAVNRQKAIIISSDRAFSPILGNNEISESSVNNDNERAQIEHEPEKPLQNATILELRGRSGRQRTVSLNIVPNIIPQSSRRSGRPRAVSQSTTPTAPHPPHLPFDSQTTPTINTPHDQLDAIGLELGDTTGVRLTSSGKIDGRSLRKLKRMSSNKENEAPTQPIEHGVQPESHGPRELVTPEDTLVPSIEKDSFAVVIPTLRSPEPEAEDFDAERPFKCEGCGKRYKHVRRLENHKALLPACATGKDDELDDEPRKKKLAEREALVKLMLEREM